MFLAVPPKDEPLLQFMVFFIGKISKIGPHLDKRQKDHLVNLDKLIRTSPT
jgi:hypothetical protein